MSISLAILWHQHQPYYKDLAAGEMVMPWVRLHGIKDYYGMARLVEEFPGMRCTINLVPSLVAQLLDYVENDVTDPCLYRTEIPAEDLAAEDVHFILDHFFMAQWDRMIRRHPRYGELLALRRFGRRPAQSAAADFLTRDLRDLQVWFQLAWFHPVCFEEHEALAALREKGRDFSEADKIEVLKVQRQVLKEIVPLHARLVEKGQVELTTTPFYHPILPLLCDMESARRAMPRAPLPKGHFHNVEDAEAHVAKAVRFHTRVFGAAPRGMWPEGSVSPEILPILARHDIRWIATDEEILSASLGTGLRGGYGRLERPDLLFRPWRLDVPDAEGRALDIVFRDHHLSDLIGFQYQSWDGEAAAADFLARVAAAARNVPKRDPGLVSVILDGENCWEHYPEQGLRFIRTLYGRLQDTRYKPVRIGDHLDAHPPSRKLGKLFSGSWINHDFYIWIGHAEDRKAWEYVFRVREDLVRETERRGVTPEQDYKIARAWEELYIAQGSDWYWWYGDDHTSGQDGLFDRLFRIHLKNVYRFLDREPPPFLDQPIAAECRTETYTRPGGVLKLALDGRLTSFFEWLGAGTYRRDREGGVMTASAPPLVSQIHFGYDVDHLCIRVDFHEGAAEDDEAPGPDAARSVALLFTEPHGRSMKIQRGPPLAVEHEGAWADESLGAQVVWDEILEMRVPFRELGVERENDLAFFVEVTSADGMTERFPRGRALQFTVPPVNVEELEWMV